MTYSMLSVLVVLVAGGVAALCAVRVRPPARWWAGTAVVAAMLVVLTAVFDSVMILADLYRYQEASLSGLRIGAAPVEDFAWPVAAALLLPSVWLLLGAGAPRAASPPKEDG